MPCFSSTRGKVGYLPMGKDLRHYPRVRVELDVTADAAGRQWHGKTMDLSLRAVKVMPLSKSVSIASNRVQLWLSLPDQDAPLALTATLERMDSDGITLSFVDLGEAESRRLKNFVDLALGGEWQKVLRPLAPLRPAF